jgi:hypothetical protein
LLALRPRKPASTIRERRESVFGADMITHQRREK